MAASHRSRLAAASVATAVAVCVGLAPPAEERAPAAPATVAGPNIVVLMTDDQTLASLRVMPNVQRLLGEEGVTFDNAVASYPLCCPSRATFLTGQYAQNHGVYSNIAPSGGYAALDHTNTLPVWLQASGYRTIHIGKYLNEYGLGAPRLIPPGWSDWNGSIEPTAGHYTDYLQNEQGTIVSYGRDEASYKTDVFARKAVGAILSSAADARPFFLNVAFTAPHIRRQRLGEPLEAAPAPRHVGAFEGEPLPRPPSFNEQDVSDKPLVNQLPPLAGATVRSTESAYRRALESLLAVDDAVAQIVDALRRSQALGETLIVFTSDNGYFYGEHRVPDSKWRPYEPSIRVPLIVRGPGLPRGEHRAQLVGNIDLAATIVDAAGATAGLEQDGRSLLPLARDPNTAWRPNIMLEGTLPPPHAVTYKGVRTARYMYTQYSNGEAELYDLQVDPDELSNQVANPAFASVRAELSAALAGLENTRPTASIRYAPAVPMRGEPVTFAAATSDPDGRVVRADWDLDGDGFFDDGSSRGAVHAFGSAGTHTVRVRVYDDDGGVAIATIGIGVAGAALASPFTPFPLASPEGTPKRRPVLAGFRVLTRRLSTALRSGIASQVRCSRRCSATAVLRLAATARGNALGRRARAVGRGRAALPAAGRKRLVTVLTRSWRRRLRASRRVELALRVVVRAPDGEAMRLTRRLTLVR